MDSVLKEKLIEIVREYECLYNTKDKDYKNKRYKMLLWERIGTMLQIEVNKAKEIWRALRDGYVRYKKQQLGKTSSGRKYSKYTWSAQLAFLDETLELRPAANTNTSITASQEAGCKSPESRISQPVQSLPQLSPQPGPSYAEIPLSTWSMHQSASSTGLLMHTGSSNSETPPSPGPPNTVYPIEFHQSLPLSEERSVKRERTYSTNLSFEERTDKVLEYLKKKNKKTHKYDDVDHLFASYAKTFKKLSRRTQTNLKISLAQLFAEAEMTELDGDTEINESPQQSRSQSPQSYVVLEKLKYENEDQ